MHGLDYLGLAHPLFPLKAVTKLTPAGYAIGTFDDPFGPVLPRLRTMLKTGKFPTVRIHAHWANDHKVVPMKKLTEKLPSYERLAKDFPAVKVYVSHSCEYDEGSAAVIAERVQAIRKLAPSCIPVNSVWRGPTIPGVLTERHGDVGVRGGFASHDGVNCYDLDVEAWKAKNAQALITFWWGYRFNLREINKPDQPVPPPSKRTAAPSDEYIESILRLCLPFGVPPTSVFPKAKPFRKPCLWKTHAEDHQGSDDPRENKPVCVLPEKANQAEVLAANGKKVGELRYGGTFHGGGYRYYSGGALGLYGYEIGKKAQKLSGSEFVWLRVGDKVYGPVNPAFRAGYFR